jgi:RNA polymerase sigma factor (TIGR02999 family)
MELPGERLDQLLERWSKGDRAALDELTGLVYRELHAIAARYRHAEGREPTLQTTELLHEAFLRLARADRTWWTNRGQFFALAAKIMRNILVDGARRRKRRIEQNADGQEPDLDDLGITVPVNVDLEGLDLALVKLEQIDPDKARLVDLRYFGGLSVDQTAEVMGIGTATVKRHWSVARAWLFRELQGELPE